MTAFSSVFAYVWVLIILVYSSPDIVTIEEAAITLGFFPLLLLLAYLADIGLFDCSTAPPPIPEGHIIQVKEIGYLTIEFLLS